MRDKLEQIKNRFEEINEKLADPSIVSNTDALKSLGQERSQLEPVIEKIVEYDLLLDNIEEAREMLETESDSEILEMAQLELDEGLKTKSKLEDVLKIMMIPKDPDDSKDIYLEIRAGTGGDEAGLFAADLMRMYGKYCEKESWKFQPVDITESNGIVKEAIFSVSGKDVYGKLKYESGVHRVQRVPKTETQGRVHTSAASVAVLPHREMKDIAINQSDLKIDTYRSSGAGGQHVNTSDSAIRITHLPTNLVVTCQNERSQLKNKETAMGILASRLQELENSKLKAEESKDRKLQVGSGDRSAKIRTYNYPQGRVTDHRINLTLYKLDAIMNGSLEDIIDGLLLEDRAEKLRNNNS